MIAVIFVKRSERFPGKHNAMLNGMPLIENVIRRVKSSQGIGRVIIYSKDSDVGSELCEVTQDKSDGSIADSLLSALELFDDLFAIAGDMPCVSSKYIDRMLESPGSVSVIPMHSNGMIEPLHSIYRAESSGALRDNIRNGKKSLRDYIGRIPHIFTKIAEEEETSFFNVNRPEDLEMIKKKGCEN